MRFMGYEYDFGIDFSGRGVRTASVLRELKVLLSLVLVIATVLWLTPASSFAQAGSAEPKAKPQSNVSLDFIASDIHDVVKALAIQSGVNIVASPDVKGEITASLKNVTVEEALKLVASLSGYKFTEVNGSYVVGTEANLKSLAAAGASFDGSRVTEVVSVKYASPGLITKMLEDQFGAVQVSSSSTGDSEGAGGPGVLVLSGAGPDVETAKAFVEKVESSLAERADGLALELYEVKYADIGELPALLMSAVAGLKVGMGPAQGFKLQCPGAVAMGTGETSGGASSTAGTQTAASKMLILQGAQEEIEKAKGLLARVDVQQPQIIIEAKVIDISDNASRGLGIEWGDEGVLDSPTFTESQSPTPQAFSIGRFSRQALGIQSKLRALVESGKGKILANPNVLALDGKPASIFIGDEVKYVIRVDRTNEGTTVTTDTARVGVQLHTISRISSDGYITMNLHPEVSVITKWIDTPAGLSLPEISRRFIDSTVRVKDGETLIVGGLIKDEDITSMSGVPILMDLPIIGSLFRSKSSSKVHSEVMMFITPRILTTM